MPRVATYECALCDRTWPVREVYDPELEDWFPANEEAAVCFRCDQEGDRVSDEY